jgi:hypothetical protein
MVFADRETKRLIIVGVRDAEKVLRNANRYQGRAIKVNGERIRILSASCLGVYFHRVPKLVFAVTTRIAESSAPTERGQKEE